MGGLTYFYYFTFIYNLFAPDNFFALSCGTLLMRTYFTFFYPSFDNLIFYLGAYFDFYLDLLYFGTNLLGVFSAGVYLLIGIYYFIYFL